MSQFRFIKALSLYQPHASRLRSALSALRRGAGKPITAAFCRFMQPISASPFT